MVAAMLLMFTSGTVCLAEDEDAPAEAQGLLPVPDYSGDLWTRTHLTGDWGGVRQDWAEKGIIFEIDWYQAYQGVVDGGIREDAEYSTNLDYHLKLDLMRMGLVPGALITVRGQSRFGNTVNDISGLLLPVNTYSYFPYTSDPDEDVNFAITELNWTQFLSENFGLLAGKVTTMRTGNEFMGGEGRNQFMNFQFNFPAVVAQLAPYSTLAVSAFWLPSPNWTVTTTLLNLQDSSTIMGFDQIGDGATWATNVDYLGSLNELPGGGSFGFFYAFDSEFAKLGGLNIDPGTGSINVDTQSSAWGLTWSGWQYVIAEKDSGTVDPLNGRQDLQGLGVFVDLGLSDKDTNPVKWSVAGGLSGRGTIPSRDDDTWGIGYFYNRVEDLELDQLELARSTSGFEVYYDIALAGWASLGLNAQRTSSAFQSVDDAWILAARLNISF
jgi:porin